MDLVHLNQEDSLNKLSKEAKCKANGMDIFIGKIKEKNVKFQLQSENSNTNTGSNFLVQ